MSDPHQRRRPARTGRTSIELKATTMIATTSAPGKFRLSRVAIPRDSDDPIMAEFRRELAVLEERIFRLVRVASHVRMSLRRRDEQQGAGQ
jgi:hypothetical protein